jgi:16S rRNA G966 N2-methylase RsmD
MDESIDLIYLDPPFNSSATYNVLLKTLKGQDPYAQCLQSERAFIVSLLSLTRSGDDSAVPPLPSRVLSERSVS